MKRYLYLMLGYPGSGKSYFSKGLAEQTGAIRFNSDQMRHYLFKNPLEHHTPADREIIVGALNSAAAPVLQAGYSVVCDLNNNFVSDRAAFAGLAKEYSAKTVVVWVKTPIALAVERGALRPLDQETIRITPDWIKRIAAEIEPPAADELCIEIDGRLDFMSQYDGFCTQLAELEKR